MTAYAGDKPILLIKKFGGILFLVFGLLLTATGLANEYTGLATFGGLLLAAGMLVLALKIIWRNQGK